MTQNFSNLLKFVQQGSGVGQLSNIVKIGWSGTGLKVTVDTTDLGLLWSDYNSFFSVSDPGNGSVASLIKLPNGIYIQTQSFTMPANDVNFTFPNAFPNRCLYINATPLSDGGVAALGYVNNLTNSGFTLHSRYLNGGVLTPTNNIYYNYIAMGY